MDSSKKMGMAASRNESFSEMAIHLADMMILFSEYTSCQDELHDKEVLRQLTSQRLILERSNAKLKERIEEAQLIIEKTREDELDYSPGHSDLGL